MCDKKRFQNIAKYTIVVVTIVDLGRLHGMAQCNENIGYGILAFSFSQEISINYAGVATVRGAHLLNNWKRAVYI